MNEIKQILRLHSQGESIKGIGRTLSISKNTVKEYLRRFESLKLDLNAALEMECPTLAERFSNVSIDEKARYAAFLARADYYQEELTKHKHLSKVVLWEEDFKAGIIQYRYSRFCYHLQQYSKSKSPAMVMNHVPGDKTYIDYAGDKLYLTDRDSGKLTPCDILVVTLGYSNFTVVVATENQRVENVNEGMSTALHQIGGTTRALVCDNFKSAVTKANRYDPVLNQSFLDMANYYSMSVVPARVRKPKDKSKVEGAVNHVYHQIYGRLRNRSFHSLHELNEVLREQCQAFNARIMKDYGVSRQTLFDRDEKHLLHVLPIERYQIMQQHRLKVQDNGHINHRSKQQNYSVPYRLIGQYVQALISPSLIKIYHQGECVATHLARPGRYITVADHLASQHKAYMESINPDRLIERGKQISEEVGIVMQHVLQRPKYPEQNYKTCQGILAMERKSGKARLVESCRIALQVEIITYQYISRLCQSEYTQPPPPDNVDTKLPVHPNLRGAQNYA